MAMALTLSEKTRTRYWLQKVLAIDTCNDQSMVSELTRQVNSEIDFILDDPEREDFRLVLYSTRKILICRLADMNDINYVYPKPDLDFLRSIQSLLE